MVEYAPPAPRATPPHLVNYNNGGTSPNAYVVKQSSDVITRDNEGMPSEIMTDMIFEAIGGTEILTVARHDTVYGQDVSFSYLKDLGALAQSFNPTNILSHGNDEGFFKQFAIDIASRMPDTSKAYLDREGNLVLEFESMNSDELVEIEVSRNGIIYTL
jgi:hypothetical protein